MVTSYALRPGWTPLTILLMVIGFFVFWPLGLAMLAYILWGDRLDGFKRDVNKATDGMFANCRRSHHRGYHARTGNVAFDDWRTAELERIEEERRKLDEELREFEAFMRDLRRARDQEEFDRFARDRAGKRKNGDTIDL